ncbi:hypothetical protein ACOMHN_030623 [Nucella lapillus]
MMRTKALDLDSAMEPYQDEPLLSVVGAVAEGVDWISESSESADENEIEIVASTSTVLADNGERSLFTRDVRSFKSVTSVRVCQPTACLPTVRVCQPTACLPTVSQGLSAHNLSTHSQSGSVSPQPVYPQSVRVCQPTTCLPTVSQGLSAHSLSTHSQSGSVSPQPVYPQSVRVCQPTACLPTVSQGLSAHSLSTHSQL